MKQKKLTKKEIALIKEPKPIETIEIEIDSTTLLSNLPLNLDLAGIFFISAFININQGEKEYNKLQKEIDKYKKTYKSQEKKHSIDTDDFVTHMLSKIRNMEIFYEPVVRYFSTAKILLVCCAEAFVNEISSVVLKGRKLAEFDKLSVIGKWLFIQDILKLDKKFDLDRNPLQGLNLLVKERNKLVHFKGIKGTLKTLEIPNYIDELKLTPEHCKANFESVRDLIITISLKWRGSYGPGWLNTEDKQFRNPCFYLGNSMTPMVLYSEVYDKGRNL
jgi:hypothetical protein